MQCPSCGSYNLEYEEYWFGEGVNASLVRYYDCLTCKHRIHSYDDEFEEPQ